MKRGMALVGAWALLLLLRGPRLASVAWGNVGMLALRDGIVSQTDRALADYPVYGVLDETPTTAHAMRSLRRAATLGADSPSARWALGRVALAVGDGEMAADALRPLAGIVRYNPLLHCDALTALSYGGQREEVIALYESASPPHPSQVISDAVAIAYLDLVAGGQGERERGGQGEKETKQSLAQARELRPGDLYVNYHLWMQAQQDSDLGAAAVYSETLTYFPLQAVHPADERLLDYAAEVIPSLLEEGLWDRDKALNVVSFLVWQHYGAAGVEQLLEQLIERYPTDPDWPFYLAELYHRRGDLDRAEAAYRQVLALDQNYAQAYLRIGMLYEARAEAEMEE